VTPILPGATLGILGSGQLGRMFTLAARQMGYRVHTYSPDRDTPTGQVADREAVNDYDDLDAVRAFARGVEVVTFEFENVPAATAAAVAEIVPVRPGGHVLHVAQNRLREKTWLTDHGIPCAPFRAVATRAALDVALRDLGCPAILKTSGFGYDGKGQMRIADPSDADDAWASLGGQECVLEGFVPFACEVSVVASRGLDGEFVHYGPIRNTHVGGILDVSVLPFPATSGGGDDAVDITRAIVDALGVVGVLCVEFFEMPDGRFLVNEMAPRPHNSGHLTIEACAAGQFEQQVRAVCGLPLGATTSRRPAAMANLLGDLWDGGEPHWTAALAMSDVHLHLYGKRQARPGRKMGHLTALADTAEDAERLVRQARASLTPTTRQD
jgi:5-(carboxyamino)imidazole ribonucleotide synthase